jgi:hypothetical protein
VSTFEDRLDKLAETVGNGNLEGSVSYDQVYAHYQHEGIGFKHPQGGQAKYLESVMQEQHQAYLQRVADGVLNDGGKDGMINAMETLAEESSQRAPIGPANSDHHPHLLRDSAHPTVTSGGEVVFDRPGAARVPDHDTTPGDRRGGNRGRR